MTNSERRISRQRAFLPAAGEAKPDWWIMSRSRQRMGFGAAFAYQSAADIFREHAALSAFENDGRRDFDLGGLAEIDDDAYETMKPVTWPVRRGAAEGPGRLFRRRAFLYAGSQGAVRRAGIARSAHGVDAGAAVSPEYRTHSRSVAYHDALGPEPAARPAYLRALCRGSSRRRQACRPRGGRVCARGDAVRTMRSEGARFRTASSAAPSSRRSTGTTRPHPMRASARSRRRSPIPIPGSLR